MTLRETGGYRNEKHFQSEVIKYAQTKGWRVYSVPDSRGATAKGFPDLVLAKEGRKPLFFELKMPNGKPTRHQRWWLERLDGQVLRPENWEMVRDYVL